MKKTLLMLLLVACGSKSAPAPATPATPEPTPAAPVAETPPAAPAEAAPAAPAPPPEPPPAQEAKVELAPTAKFKSKVKGTIAFKEVPGGVELTANLEGLNAGKQHAWHIHEKGDCSAPDATSAGAHFNPGKHDHGGPDSAAHHAGDFGNVTADKAGKATLTVVMKGVTIADGETSIVGKAFIVHAKADDLKSQPAGNAGDRIACGVIAK